MKNAEIKFCERYLTLKSLTFPHKLFISRHACPIHRENVYSFLPKRNRAGKNKQNNKVNLCILIILAIHFSLRINRNRVQGREVSRLLLTL